MGPVRSPRRCRAPDASRRMTVPGELLSPSLASPRAPIMPRSSTDDSTGELPDPGAGPSPTLRQRLVGWLAGLLGPSPAHERLAGELAVYDVERDYLLGGVEEAEDAAWRTDIDRCLENARAALDRHETELGWRFLYAARRIELSGLAAHHPDAFRARTAATKREAFRKLDGWRLEAVEDLLGPPGEPIDDVDASDAHLATLLLQEHYDTYYQKVRIHSRQLWWLVGVAGVAVGLVLLIAAVGGSILEGVSITSSRMLSVVVLFGVLGAAVSGILSLARSGVDSRLSRQVLASWVTYARLVIGGASALVMLAFLTSGLATLVFQNVVSTPGFVLFVAFATGFSERLLVRAIESVSGDAERPATHP